MSALPHMAVRRASTAAAASAYSHIIVGAGSAGCVLAARLSEDSANRVLLLEAGRDDRRNIDAWKVQMPAALTYNLADAKYNWAYMTEPQAELKGRRLPWPRGKVLGGSSSLNAMVYVRGHAKDYDRWESKGAAGWSYADCLPYFKKAQTHELGPDEYRGGDGPLHVTRGKQTCPLFAAFEEAGVQAGYPRTEDMNGYQQEGFGRMDLTIYQNRRWSTANAYLRPVMSRPNLTVRTCELVSRVLIEGKRATGVAILQSGGDMEELIHCDGEVVLCAGAINSPQLLMLSGVGDRAQLESHGIDVKAHLPGVGQNLQDHLDLYVQYACKQPVTLFTASWRFPHNMIRYGAEWFMGLYGKASTSHLESGGFIRSRAGVEHPDVQYHFLPGALTGQLNPGQQHAFQLHCSTMRPLSRGELTLASRDPRAAPRIDPRYLEHPQDLEDYITAVRLTREIAYQAAFDPYRGEALSPGPEVATDAQLAEWIRNHTESAYHPCSTCAMGVDDASVVDPDCRVHGIEALRVVDASVMPDEASGNLNAPTIMIAEKAADKLRGRPPLPPATGVPVYEAPDWETRQR